MATGWLEAARAVDVEAVARELGMEILRVGFGPCPACGAEQREKGSPRRGPCGMTPERRGWGCHRCKAHGDALDLVAMRLAGARFREVAGRPGGLADVRAWYASRGWCDAEPGARTVSAPAPRPVPKPAPVVDTLPPASEVEALWDACERLDAVGMLEPGALYLEHRRGLSLRELAALDVVRVLPSAYPWPRWVPTLGLERSEWLRLYRLAVPMYDARGALRGLRFRLVDAVRSPGPDGMTWGPPDGLAGVRVEADGRLVVASTGRKLPKCVSQRRGCAGLVLADVAGLELLRGSERELWDGVRVVVAEGEANAWSYATAARHDAAHWSNGRTWAVIGIFSGSWTDAAAARIPSGAVVIVRTDADTDENHTGKKYEEDVRASLASRCRVLRVPSWTGANDG